MAFAEINTFNVLIFMSRFSFFFAFHLLIQFFSSTCADFGALIHVRNFFCLGLGSHWTTYSRYFTYESLFLYSFSKAIAPFNRGLALFLCFSFFWGGDGHIPGLPILHFAFFYNFPIHHGCFSSG